MTGLPAGFPDPSLARAYGSVLELVGNTPLVRLNVLTQGLPGSVWVKLDHYNIGGSSKDRIGVHILREAENTGWLDRSQHVIETGQGNTAIGLALAGLLDGHGFTVIAKPDLSREKLNLLRLLGAHVVPGRLDVPKDDPEHSWNVAARREDDDPDTWWARQQSNLSNPQAHYLSTGPEIWHQSAGKITHFVAALATGGTISGAGRYLKEQNPQLRLVGTTFDLPQRPWADAALNKVFHKLPGWEEAEQDWADNIDLELIDELHAATKEEAIDFAFHLARTEGLLLGLSSVLSIKRALELAADAEPGEVIVAFSADHARDYLSAEYDESWLREHELGHLADKWFQPDNSAEHPQ